MIQNLREEWLILFAESKNSISIVNPPVTVICDDKFIMDYIFLVSNHGPTFLHYLSCISQVFIKYRLSFNFSKCDFSSHGWIFGHDLTTLGKCPAQSKFS